MKKHISGVIIDTRDIIGEVTIIGITNIGTRYDVIPVTPYFNSWVGPLKTIYIHSN